MIFARRKIALGSSYAKNATFKFGKENPVWKLTVACTDEVVMQISESYPPTFPGAEDITKDVELDKGTHSLSFVNEVHGIRFRASNVAAVISFRCYGPAQES